jgi:hypothetical protein
MLLMRWMHVLFGLIVAATFASCRHQIVTPFNENEFLPYARFGTSTIQGQAFLKTRGGEVRYAAGNTVYLMPVTSYSREIYSFREMPSQVDERLYIFLRTTTADGSGNFEFKNIPAGEYYIECGIFWEYVGRFGLGRTGDNVKIQTKVGSNQVLKVVLTK